MCQEAAKIYGHPQPWFNKNNPLINEKIPNHLTNTQYTQDNKDCYKCDKALETLLENLARDQNIPTNTSMSNTSIKSGK